MDRSVVMGAGAGGSVSVAISVVGGGRGTASVSIAVSVVGGLAGGAGGGGGVASSTLLPMILSGDIPMLVMISFMCHNALCLVLVECAKRWLMIVRKAPLRM